MSTDPTPQATPSAATTSTIVANGIAPALFTTGPHAWRLARKNGELILQGLMRCTEDRYGYREYWETLPTIDLTDPVYNNTGAEIPSGTPVYVTGSSGTRITIAPADASVDVENVTAAAAADPPLWQLMLHAYDNAPAPPRDAPDDWTDRQGYAAEILAVQDRVAPEEAPPVAPTDSPAWLHWQQRQAIRALLTAEAARAEAGE